MFVKSRKKEIGIDDLYAVLDAHKADGLGEKMSKAWNVEVTKAKAKNKEPSLLRASLTVFGWQIALLGVILALIEFLLK